MGAWLTPGIYPMSCHLPKNWDLYETIEKNLQELEGKDIAYMEMDFFSFGVLFLGQNFEEDELESMHYHEEEEYLYFTHEFVSSDNLNEDRTVEIRLTKKCLHSTTQNYNMAFYSEDGCYGRLTQNVRY